MKYKKILALVCSLTLMAGVIFTGCSNSSSNSNGKAESNVSESADNTNSEETSIFGQISSIDGNTLTIALSEPPQMRDGNGNAPGNMPEGSTEMQIPDETSTASDGMNQGGGMMGGLTLTGEEQTITVDDDTVITVRNGKDTTEGTFADLAQEDIVTVVMNGDNVVSITVGFGMGPGGKKA